MKFLCVPCDQPMVLSEKKAPDEGSIALVYSCDACGYEMAMLTNAHETQMVTSLGVKIGPDGEKQNTGASKCPFTGIVNDMGSADANTGMRWTSQAEERLESIPTFIRPMARTGIEKYAKDNGFAEVDESVLEQARSHFGV